MSEENQTEAGFENRSGRPLVIAGEVIRPGRSYDLHLDYSQSYTGMHIKVPVRVVSGPKPGPVVFFTGVVHGDEINGLGIIRELMFENELNLKCGVVIAVPVVNIYGMDSHSRYLPDRRDPNRCFPGTAKGSLTSRLAHLIYTEIIRQCHFGVDLHTAAVRRTNYPNIRADLDNPEALRLARSFGCELLVHSRGAEGSLRRTACKQGIPTIVLEAGEVWKIEPGVVDLGALGARNVLCELGMLAGRRRRGGFQLEVRKSVWVRAENGGILKYHVAPGDVVEKGQVVGTSHGIFGDDRTELISPADGVILGMTTMPAVKPGEPVFHVALSEVPHSKLKRKFAASQRARHHQRVHDDLATSLLVEEPE